MAEINLKLDRFSMLVTVDGSASPGDIENALNQEGVSIGYCGNDTKKPISEYFSGNMALEPFLKFGDLHDLVASIGVKLENGKIANTFLTPRSAAGPNLRYLLSGNREKSLEIQELTLRVREAPNASTTDLVVGLTLEKAIEAIRTEVQMKNRPEVIRVYDEHSSNLFFGTDEGSVAILYVYEGEQEKVRFRAGHFEEKLSKIGAVSIPSDQLQFGTTAPHFLEKPKDTDEQAEIHFISNFSDITKLVAEISKRIGSVCPYQLTVTNTWHTAALLSLRLLSKKDEGDDMLLRKELEELLDITSENNCRIIDVKLKRSIVVPGITEPWLDTLSERYFTKR